MGVGAGLYMCNVVVKKFTIHERYRQPDGQTDRQTDLLRHGPDVESRPNREKQHKSENVEAY